MMSRGNKDFLKKKGIKHTKKKLEIEQAVNMHIEKKNFRSWSNKYMRENKKDQD